MSTVMKQWKGPSPAKEPRQHDQLRRDRWVAIVIVAVLFAVMALTIWLGSFQGGPVYEDIDYWHLMP